MATPKTAWKPPKPATGGSNYGAAVSAAAHTRNAARSSARPVTTGGVPASRQGPPQSGSSEASVSSPRARRAAGIPKTTPVEPPRVAGVAAVKNPGIHSAAGAEAPSGPPAFAGKSARPSR